MITEAELAEGSSSGSDEVSVAFADLVGFTGLGEQLEIDALGDLNRTALRLATEAAQPPVRLVKMIGDAAMFASTSRPPGRVGPGAGGGGRRR